MFNFSHNDTGHHFLSPITTTTLINLSRVVQLLLLAVLTHYLLYRFFCSLPCFSCSFPASSACRPIQLLVVHSFSCSLSRLSCPFPASHARCSHSYARCTGFHLAVQCTAFHSRSPISNASSSRRDCTAKIATRRDCRESRRDKATSRRS